jgi:hypothetical protein
MGYYQGDFYAGARGDPGFLSFIGRAVGGVSKVIQKITGGGSVSPRLGAPAAAGAASSAIKAGGQAIIKSVSGAIVKHPVVSAAAAAGVVGAAGTASVESLMSHPAMKGMRGFHVSRKTGKVVRNRRMNVANGRALSRAVRRLHHFAKKYRKVVGFVSPHKPKGRMYFKKRRKAA